MSSLTTSESEATASAKHPPNCTCGLHQMTSLHEMAAKRKQFRKNEKTRADVADSLFKTLSQKMKIAQEKGNKSEIVVLKRQLKKALISTHDSAAALPSIDKLDYEDFSEFDFFGQRVYLGRFRPAVQQSGLLVSELAVAGILNVTEEFGCPTVDGLDTKKIPVKDRPSEGPRLAAYFQQASAFLDGLNCRPVYIHCRQGVSRSVTVLLAHLIIKGVDLRDGYDMIRKGRPSARPNAGFWEELCKFEQKVLNRNSYPLAEYNSSGPNKGIGKHEMNGMKNRIDSILKAREHGTPPPMRIQCQGFAPPSGEAEKQEGTVLSGGKGVEFDRGDSSNSGRAFQRTIHFVRHGEADHNLLASKIGKKAYVDPSVHDPPLTEKGIQDAVSLQDRMKELAESKHLDAIVASTMNRALMTADVGCVKVQDMPIPRIVLECVRERVGHHICDGRRALTEIKAQFPEFNFDAVESEEDILQTPERETYAQMIGRAYDFFQWLIEHPEYNCVAVYSHSSFLFTIFQGVFDYPYGDVDTTWFRNGECRSVNVTIRENNTASTL